MTRIFVAVAWPYANGPFHIGHLAGAYLPGDIFARYHRLRGSEVLFVSGSDMHGTPILVTAEREGVPPQAIAERYDAVIRRSFERLGFSFDLFTHTHTLVHERTAQELFFGLLERRLVARKTEEFAFCPTHGRFLPDRYLVGTCPHCGFESARGDECDRCGRVLGPRDLLAPRCSLDGSPAEFRPSEHFYLALDALAGPLAAYLADKSYWRPNVLGVAQNFLREGLRPTPITRDLDWGIPIPLEGYPSKRFYVWFEAVIGYLSASREWAIRAGRPDAWRRYWDADEQVRQYYFIGKDNVFHHTIVWPAILLGVGGYQRPYDVPANAWLLVGGTKISRSRTREADVFVPALLDRFPPDVIRFYAAQLAPQNHDTEFDWAEFRSLGEEVLANQWGNLVQRTLVLTRDREAGRIPEPPAGWDPSDARGVGPRLHAAHRRITEELEAVHLKEALDLVFQEIREGNRRFHDGKPWQADDPDRRRILYESLWLVKAAATWLLPYLPFSSAEVATMLGEPEPPGRGDWDRALEPPEAGRPLGAIRPLFPKELPLGPPEAPEAAAPAGAPAPAASPAPIDVRVARILSAEPHPSADRLYVLRLDAGEAAPRTVVAGLRGAYSVEALVGRSVALLANLAPRTIRKVTSQGMVLAADVEGRAALVVPPADAAPGTPIEGLPGAAPVIEYADFERSPLLVGRVVVAAEGRTTVDLGGPTVAAPGSWPPDARVVVRLPVAGAGEGVIVSFGPGKPLSPPAEAGPGARVR
ncbi:MAG TPA: methionine--tRNA ligase [Thermoplasmata archaeon]|nr:methionine--tRNA ligase [Thermoplasmata archaeon]